MKYTTRSVVTREDAKAEMEPYASTLQECLENAFHSVQETLDEKPVRRVRWDTSIWASIIYMEFVAMLETALLGNPDVKISRVGRMVMFRFGPKIRLRFKKFDPNLRTSNIRTKHQEGLYHQLVIPGLENDVTDLTFGYLTNRVGTKIQGIYLTCPKDWKRNHWRIEFVDPMMGENLFITPAAPTPPTNPTELPLVRPKTAGRQKVSGE